MLHGVMHPWIAHIHPSLRTTFIAWSLSRATFFVACIPHTILPIWPDAVEGTPAWVALLHVANAFSLWMKPSWALAIMAEVAMGFSLLGVYTFIRKDTLPQTAERATWLWAMSPLMLAILPAQPWTFAIAFGILAFGCAVSMQPLRSGLCFALALGFAPEIFLLTPAFIMSAAANRGGKAPPSSYAIQMLVPWISLCTIIFMALALGGHAGISMRTLHQIPWRDQFIGLGWQVDTPELILLIASLCALSTLLLCIKCVPRVWFMLSGCALLMPWIHQDATAASGLLLLAMPLFATLAKRFDDPSMERILLIASMLTTFTLARMM